MLRHLLTSPGDLGRYISKSVFDNRSGHFLTFSGLWIRLNSWRGLWISQTCFNNPYCYSYCTCTIVMFHVQLSSASYGIPHSSSKPEYQTKFFWTKNVAGEPFFLVRIRKKNQVCSKHIRKQILVGCLQMF